MSAGCDYSIDSVAVASLSAGSAREQRMLLDAFDRLAQNPTIRGDYSFSDEAGRINEVLDLGDFMVTFWSDPAVRMVRIPMLERT
jgi:hypothetical protein